MINKKILDGIDEISIDTGIYIKYFQEEENDLKKNLRKFLFHEKSNVRLYGHYLLKAEIYYILCRSLGREQAEEIIKEIEEFINFIDSGFLYQIAGQIKCEYPIALPDCYSIAVGFLHSCPILFLKEEELSDEIINKIKENYNVDIYVIS